MEKQEVAISSWSSGHLFDSFQGNTGGQNQTKIVAVEINILRRHVSSSWELLLVIGTPCGSKNQNQGLVSLDFRKEQSELRVLNSELQGIVTGILMRSARSRTLDRWWFPIKTQSLPMACLLLFGRCGTT